MNQTTEFVIQDGVLLQYRGTGGTVIVPEGVRGIRAKAFRGSDAEEVILPEGLVWMGSGALSGCHRLRRLVLPASLRVVPSRLCRQVAALEEVVIPEGVVVLSDQAFQETGLRSVTIPGSVRTIGISCFSACARLQTVTLKEGIRNLQFSAFASCGNLRSISFPDSLRCVQPFCFHGCRRLQSIRMGRGAETIGSCAFAECPQLRDVEFPAALESVGRQIFQNCPSLERVTFRGNRVEFSDPHFPRNPSDPEPPLAPVVRTPRLLPKWIPAASRPAALKGYDEMKAEGWPLDLEIAEAWEACATGTGSDSSGKPAAAFQIVDGILCGVASPDGRVVVPDGVVGIRAEAFQGTAVRKVWLPDSVAWIQPGTFADCGQLREVRLPAGLTRIPDCLFSGCRNLRNIRIPDGVAHIDPGAFTESGLESLDLPPLLEFIGESAFLRCHQLKEVRFPQGLRFILQNAFQDCTSLTEVTLPDSLEVLEWGVFDGCTALERVRVGTGLGFLALKTFGDCASLKEVSLSADHCQVEEDCFAGSRNFLSVRMEGTLLELEPQNTPLRIVAPNADPAILNDGQLGAFLRGFASEDGKGFRYEEKYLELLRLHRREVWDSEEVLRFLLRRNLLEQTDIQDCLDFLQNREYYDLVAEVLEYCHQRFPDPAAPLLLE